MVYLDVITWDGRTSYIELDIDNRSTKAMNSISEIVDKVDHFHIMNKCMVGVENIRELHLLEGSQDFPVLNLGEFSHLKVLTLPKDMTITHIWCEDTMVEELEVPLSVKQISCNPNTEITNFDELGDDVELLMVPVYKSIETVMKG